MAKYSQLGVAQLGDDATTGGIFDPLGFAGYVKSATEAHVQTKAKAGTADKLSVGVSANTFTSTITVTWRKAAAAGNQTVTSSGNGQFVDSTHSDTFADSDLINTKSVGASGVAYIATIISIGVRIDHTANYTSYWAVGSNASVQSYGTTTTSWCAPIGGTLNGFQTVTEAIVALKVRAAGTWDDLSFYSVSNSKAGNTTIKSRINGADGNQVVTVTSSGTGLFADSTHSDTVASGDVVDVQFSTATAGTLTGRTHSRFVSSGTLQDWFLHDMRTANNGANAIRFWPIYGCAVNDATEANANTTIQFGNTAQNLRQYVTSQATAAGWNLVLRIAGADGNQLVASGTGTGWTEDSTHSDTFSAGQTLSYKTTASSNGTSLTSIIAMTQGVTSSPGSASGTTPEITLTAPTGGASGGGAASGSFFEVTLTAPTGGATGAGAAAGTIPQVTLTAPVGSATAGASASGTIPEITLTAPTATIAIVTQEALIVSAVPSNEARVTYGSLNALAKIATQGRVTGMTLLVLAKGGDAPLVPDPLSLHDMGRNPVLRQRLVNMYVEPTPQGPERTAHYQRPGLYSVAQRGGGPGRATFLFQGFRITVSGGSVWRDDENIGNIPDDPKTRYATSEEECVVVANGRAYYVTLTDVAQITDPDLPRVRDVLFIAGRFIYIRADTSGIYDFSEVNDAQNIDGLSFASAESSPDPLVGGVVIGDNFLLMGTLTGEWHYPVDDQNAPFLRSKGRRYDKGCPAIRSIVLADNSGFFVGSDRMVYRTGAVPARVSNYDVEDSLRRVTDEDLPDITAYAVTYGGHTFYVMNLPEQGTWALDIGQGLWARWKSHGRDRFRVDFCDNNFMLDLYSGNILGFDGAVMADFAVDGTDPIERVCSTFARLPSGVLHNFNLALFCTRGVGLVGGTGDYGVNPVVEMRMSDAEGGDWSEWMEAPLGPFGDRTKGSLALWTQLGMVSSPGRLFEFRCSDPVFFAPYAVRMNEPVM